MVSIALLIVLGAAASVLLIAIGMSVYALRVEKRYHGQSKDILKQPVRSPSKSGDIHLILRFQQGDEPDTESSSDDEEKRFEAFMQSLIQKIENVTHAHVSSGYSSRVVPFDIKENGVYIYIRLRTRTPIEIEHQPLTQSSLVQLINQMINLSFDSIIGVTINEVKPSKDRSAMQMIAL